MADSRTIVIKQRGGAQYLVGEWPSIAIIAARYRRWRLRCRVNRKVKQWQAAMASGQVKARLLRSPDCPPTKASPPA